MWSKPALSAASWPACRFPAASPSGRRHPLVVAATECNTPEDRAAYAAALKEVLHEHEHPGPPDAPGTAGKQLPPEDLHRQPRPLLTWKSR
jgi:hypothetical protein